MKTITIANKLIGENQPVFVIAEAGVNHNGKLELAKKLVDTAVKADADAIKFQTFKAEGLVTDKVDAASYAKKNIQRDIKQINMIKKLELKYEDFHRLKEYCDKNGKCSGD